MMGDGSSRQTTTSPSQGDEDRAQVEQGVGPLGRSSRRSFLAGAGAGALGAGLFADVSLASAHRGRRLTAGDEAILRFVAAAETLEADFWQQYNELGGVQDSEVPGGSGSPAYTAALAVLDSDMAQYVHDNTHDEFSHFEFLNAYLEARGDARSTSSRFATCPAARRLARSRSSASPT